MFLAQNLDLLSYNAGYYSTATMFNYYLHEDNGAVGVVVSRVL
jgi:hypothetical protein